MTDLEFAGQVFQCVRSAGGSSDLMKRCRQNIIKAQAALRQVAELEAAEKEVPGMSAYQDEKRYWNIRLNRLDDLIASADAKIERLGPVAGGLRAGDFGASKKIKRLDMSIDCLRQGERHVEERFDLVAGEIRGIKERLEVLESERDALKSKRDAEELTEAERRSRGPSPYDAVGPLNDGGGQR